MLIYLFRMFNKITSWISGTKEPPESQQNHEENIKEEVQQRMDFILSALDSDFCHTKSKSSLETRILIKKDILRGPLISKDLK